MSQDSDMPGVLKREPMRPVDVAWLRMDEPNNLMQINGVIALEGRLDVEELRRRVLERWRDVARFRHRVVRRRGRIYWEDDPAFDIARHVVRTELPAPGDDAAAQQLFGQLMSEPLDPAHPLWKFHVIEGFGGGTALFARLHHAMGDGVGLMLVLLSLLDLERNPDEASRPNPFCSLFGQKDASLAAFRQVADEIMPEAMRLLLMPVEAYRRSNRLVLGVAALGALLKLIVCRRDPRWPLKGPLVPRKHAAWTRPLPLDEVKMVSRVLGGTINDALLSAVGGGLRRYLAGRGAAPHESLVIRAVMPVNLRTMEGLRQLGNQFGLAFLGIPVGIADPQRRMAEVKRHADKLKRSAEPLVVYGLLHVAGLVPLAIERLMLRIFGSKGTAVMTNLPAPRRPLYLSGRKVEDLFFWVPQSARLGLGISILSYAGRVRLGFAADAGIVPDVAPLLDGFYEEWAAMVALARTRTPAPEPAPEPAPAPAPRSMGIGPS